MRPKLAYLFSRYPVVTHTFIDNEILALEANGWDVVVASLSPPKNDFRHERLDTLQAPILYSPGNSIQQDLQRIAEREGRWPTSMIVEQDKRIDHGLNREQRCKQVLPLVGALEMLGVDHVHLHFANRATHSALFLKSLAGISFSFTPQAQDFLVDLKSIELLQELCAEAEFVVAPCQFALQELERLCPHQIGKFRCIYNGVNPDSYLIASPRPSPASFKVISVGRLIEFKGYHFLIEAVAAARAKGVMVSLEIFGDGPWRGQLEGKLDELGLRGQVSLPGTIELQEMRKRLSRADAFALPCCVDENGAMDMFPTIITEAMLSGLPVLSSNLAAVPEQVHDGITGILTKPGDVDGLCEALVLFAKEPALAAKMGSAGLRRAKKLFSVTATLPLLEEEFEKVNGRRERADITKTMAYVNLNRTRSLDGIDAINDADVALWVSGGLGANPMILPANAKVFWMPDGMALEMEWQRCNSRRRHLESLRTELSTSIDGEWFFEAAREALWIAVQGGRIGINRLVALGTHETLVVWLVAGLAGWKAESTIDQSAAFKGKLKDRIKSDVSLLSTESREPNPLRS